LLEQIAELRARVEELESERADLQNLLESTTDHSDLIEAELDKKNDLLRSIFGRYITKEVVTEILGSPDGLKFGGQRRRITMLTSDLRGFTTFSEQVPAEQVIRIINHYLGAMADVITSYQGTIDEFMGDGILVFFGAPTPRDDDALRAVACGLAMQLALGKVNQQVEAWGFPPLQMGIGINTGEVVVGNIGCEKRAKYGVVGSQVNLTYRVESFTTGGQVLVSESTHGEVAAHLRVHRSFQVSPKGLSRPITVYDVVGVTGPYSLALERVEEVLEDLPAPVRVPLVVLVGKEQGAGGHAVEVVALGDGSARVRATGEGFPPGLAVMTNVLLSLGHLGFPPGAPTSVYAKVVSLETGAAVVRFTSVAVGLRDLLVRWAEAHAPR
jgi:adenylate cyclase